MGKNKKSKGRIPLAKSYAPLLVDNVTTTRNTCKGNTLDLHGYSIEDAEAEVVEFLREKKKENREYVNIITGRGSHSKNGVCVTKNIIKEVVSDCGYRYEWCSGNGMMKVFLCEEETTDDDSVD